MLNGALTLRQLEYLVAIAEAWERGARPRNRALARQFDVQPATVTATMQALARGGFVEYARYRCPRLTKAGQSATQHLQVRAQISRGLLEAVGVSPETAARGAVRLAVVLTEADEARIGKAGAPVVPELSPVERLKDCMW